MKCLFQAPSSPGIAPAIHVLQHEQGKQDVDARAFATPKSFGPAGGTSPGMTSSCPFPLNTPRIRAYIDISINNERR
jgi:hypothetical protein